jgi:hypothetical protein
VFGLDPHGAPYDLCAHLGLRGGGRLRWGLLAARVEGDGGEDAERGEGASSGNARAIEGHARRIEIAPSGLG